MIHAMGAIWPRCQVRGPAARGRGSGSSASLQRCPGPPRHALCLQISCSQPLSWVPLPARRDPLKGAEFSDEETRRKFDKDFSEDAVRLVRETGKPIAQWPGTWASTRAPWATIDAYARGLVEYVETRERDGTDPLTATRAHVAGFGPVGLRRNRAAGIPRRTAALERDLAPGRAARRDRASLHHDDDPKFRRAGAQAVSRGTARTRPAPTSCTSRNTPPKLTRPVKSV
jgi:hypothetical protein